MKIVIKNNFGKVGDELHDAVLRALVRCGQKAHSYAVDLVPVDTGNLKNSIAFGIDADRQTMHIGSPVKYAPYVEFGTGIHSTYPGGRPDKWGYIDDEGVPHSTRGNKAQPFIKPAIAEHTQTYINIIEDELKNG